MPKIYKTPWCQQSIETDFFQEEFERVLGRCYFCFSGLRKWDVKRTDTIRLCISKRPVEGAQESFASPPFLTLAMQQKYIEWEVRDWSTIWWWPEVLD